LVVLVLEELIEKMLCYLGSQDLTFTSITAIGMDGYYEFTVKLFGSKDATTFVE
jgi:hypothetical protein